MIVKVDNTSQPSIELPTLVELATELTRLKTLIDDDMVAEGDDTPSMDITLGSDHKGYGLQTGDNSYTGGAYGFAHWGVTTLTRRSNCRELAKDLHEQCIDLATH